METGVITQWLVKVGDQVKEGDVVADIETDKATMPMKSYDEGTVVLLDHAAGDEVALGTRVMVLAKLGEDPKQVAEALRKGEEKGKPASPGAGGARPAEDRAKQPSSAAAGDRSRAGDNGQEAPAAEQERAGGRVKASPLARKIAASAQIDLGRVHGSGPGGRVVRRDVEAHLQRPAETRPASTGAPAASGGVGDATAAPAARPSTTPLAASRIPHSRMRKTIAQRMLEAKLGVPEIHLSVDVRADRILAARAEINRHLQADGIKVSLGDFVTKGVALALRFHPGLNASFEPDAIIRHGEINIGIAVALPDGLIVPVLHHADGLGLREIRVESEALAVAARSNRLTGEQLSGGTFTISNLGMYGTRQFDAIINLPQVAILAVGAAEKRAVVEDDRLAVGTVMTLTLTADHRAVDGAVAAQFLATLKGLLEEPASMLV
jgi:pyruvate dehydrogenase E2 component (dihydrolipoamide acetyltransferase)